MNKKPNVIHYGRLNPEPIDIIHQFKLGFNLGNVIKYLARAGFKNSEVDDLRKAINYLNFELDYDAQEYTELNIDSKLILTLWSDLTYHTEIETILGYVALAKKNEYIPKPYIAVIKLLELRIIELSKKI